MKKEFYPEECQCQVQEMCFACEYEEQCWVVEELDDDENLF